MERFESLETALALAKKNYRCYPLSRNSKAGVRGGHAFNDATVNSERLRQLFQFQPYANVGMVLDGVIVVDVDNHDNNRGTQSLKKLAEKGMVMPNDTYIEKTPSGGLHYFFKADTKAKNIPSAFFEKSSVEIKTDHIIIAPSVVNGVPYTAIDNGAEDFKPAPPWLLAELDGQRSKPVPQSNYTPMKKYTGKLLDELVTGAPVGDRNNSMTRMAGKMFRVGAEPETVQALLNFYNNQCDEPLPDKDVDRVFSSILKSEIRKLKRGL